MDTAGDDPDPGGSIRPAVFYGLWPRFAFMVEAESPDEAETAAEAEAVPIV